MNVFKNQKSKIGQINLKYKKIKANKNESIRFVLIWTKSASDKCSGVLKILKFYKTCLVVCFEDFDKILRTRYSISRTIANTGFGSWFVLIVKMFW